MSALKIEGVAGVSGLDGLVAELEREARVAPAEARKVVAKGLLNIKADWRRRWTGYPHVRALPFAITYETAAIGPRVSGEVGPDKNRPQGPLGNLLEYGSPNNAPIPGGAPALRTEQPKFERAMEALGFAEGPPWR